MSQPNRTTVSVVIKAYNEEEYVDSAIRSALAAIEPVGGEVILADSLSTDRTVAIALGYPVTIVQLRNPDDRRCGAGPQLGFQAASGEFVYILDGDMELAEDFLPLALEAMLENPKLAGVAGLIRERHAGSYQYRGNSRRNEHQVAGEVEWLNGGGLYRRAALQQIGYCSNRNLHAFEEMDLGLRLRAAGWHLLRLPVLSAWHNGHTLSSWKLLKQRWRSHYLDGAGEVLRASVGKAWFRSVAQSQTHLFIGIGIWIGTIVGLLLLPITPWVLTISALSVLVLVALRAFRIGSLVDALFGQVVWQITSLAMLRGFLAPPADPGEPIESRIVAVPDGQQQVREQFY